MKRIRLTAARVAGFECPPDKNQVFLWDSDAPGFALRATRGSKAYIFQGRFAERALRMTIGDVSVWGIDDARQEARRLQAVIDAGRDPRQTKAELTAADIATRAKAKQAKTPAIEAWRVYLKARAGKWSARTLLDHERLTAQGGQPKKRGRKQGEPETTQPGLLYHLLQHPLRKIDRLAVATWLKDNQHRPTQARGAFVRLRAFLNWCTDQPDYAEQVHADACLTRTLKAELPKQEPKKDSLQREMLRAWFDAVGKIQNPVHSVYLQALLLTGCRREELAALKWCDVDLKWNSLSIADKVEQEQGRTIPLTPYVKSLLLSIKSAPISAIHGALTPEGSPWVPRCQNSWNLYKC